MIQLLATKYRKSIAFTLFLLFDLSFFLSAEAAGAGLRPMVPSAGMRRPYNKMLIPAPMTGMPAGRAGVLNARQTDALTTKAGTARVLSVGAASAAPNRVAIGGPNQPEMTSFKPADMRNMVNLFTGDFSYNIPLLDVGGYPVNLFYRSEIGPEQEASWVGLGWNINPGNINRNMRGIPDDFNGTEKLLQVQNMKPNVTWGVGIAADAEFLGLKHLAPTTTFNAGVSWNNYLGIALDLGVKGGLEFKVAGKAGSEKSPSMNLGLDLALDLNSRSGLTISPSASLTGNAFLNDRTFNLGAGLSTSYNSRVGIRSLQINDQLSISKISEKTKHYEGFDLTSHVRSRNAANLFSTSISFARPSYTPSIRVPMVNKAFAGHFQLGSGMSGVYASAEAEVYNQTSRVDPNKVTQRKPMMGYLYAEEALKDPNAVMDFTRLNDREVTPNTPLISAPQYTYDVFSIQGEGTGGTIRAYRSDPGYVRDNATGSTDDNDAIGADIGPPGHWGGNFNTISTPSSIGEWVSGNSLRSAIPFRGREANTAWENVYFRNPGETSVLDDGEYDGIGGTNLVRFKLSGDAHDAFIQAKLDNFSRTGSFIGATEAYPKPKNAGRKKRTQLIDFLTAGDAACFGLDRVIRNYDNQTFLDPATNTLRYTAIPRYTTDGYRLQHHISEIHVTETDGKRYVYGIPVYNTTQKDFTFTVKNSDLSSPDMLDQVKYEPEEADPHTNPAIDGPVDRDGYAQRTTTPAYAHSFLLSGLLSPDYVDITGDGITDDDFGNAVKFNYTQILGADGTPAHYKWRTPIGSYMANFNAGNRSNFKDDKGLISYGERESWYLHSIESKTMIAIFTLLDRMDGQSVADENGTLDNTNHALKCLSKIELFSKADLKKNGYGTASGNAKPIKTVNFIYDYSLCHNTPDNPGSGKLTLTGVSFSYNNQNNRTNKDRYVFSYDADAASNPGHEVNAADRWGTYKPRSMNPAGMRNADYPYTPQQVVDGNGNLVSAKPSLDQNAGAWSLKKILLPSGGQIEVGYESDDYAFVQDRRAMEMMSIAGFGSSSKSFSNELYSVYGGTYPENIYLFVNVPESCTEQDVFQKYLSGVRQLAVRLMVNMPKGKEYITSYASFDPSPNRGNYGLYRQNSKLIWIKLATVANRSPLSLSALEYLREQLPAQAFPGYDVSGEGLEAIGDALAGMIDAISGAFSDPINHFRSRGLARHVQLDHSFVRLNDPDGYKFGGGQRVKSLKLKDNWQAMSGTYNTVYDQEYNYETTETFNGKTRKISSGVASYEPAMGGEENPFQSAFLVADKVPLGPTSYGSVEMPVLESFFPSPVVGYSKVTVTSMPTNAPTAQKKTRSGIGRQVTEFYTAKDYPVFYSHTSLDGTTDLQAHDASTTNFFSKYAFDSRTISQGFLIALNDMHGKLRSQSSYAENDPTLRVNYTGNFYRNTGVNGMNETFDFVSADAGGAVKSGNLGIDVELMTDTREFRVSSRSEEVQGQVDLFPVFLPIWLPFIWPVEGSSENIYRAVTTTKVITYHSVLDSVIVIDKGSKVGTKNLLFDAETGQPIVTRTNNEFDKPQYSTTYPAWWAYSGMGPAYRNTEVLWSDINISDGKLVSGSLDPALLESGDELFSGDPNPVSSGCPPASPPTGRIWVMDKNKNNPPFPAMAHDFIFIDSLGRPYTNTNIKSLRVIRSGKRNMLDAVAAAVTSMVSPIVTNGNSRKLSLGGASAVLNATAMEFSEKWQVDKGVIGTFSTVSDPATCGTSAMPACNGYLDKNINPYRNGLLGNFRGYRTMTFYDNRAETDPGVPTNLAQNGSLANFSLYWDFDASNALVPNASAANWIETNRVTRINSRGLELETKNAANIYTAAQYGYSKTLPVAVTNNSPYYQSLYEGFEDRGYSQGLDNDPVALCPSGQPDFMTLAQSYLVNTDTSNFTAHTGKYCLALPANTASSIKVPVTAGDNLGYNLVFGSHTPQIPNNPGGNLTNITFRNYAGTSYPDPTWYITQGGIFVNGGFQMHVTPGGLGPQGYYDHSIDIPFSYYIVVPAKGTFDIYIHVDMGLRSEDDAPVGSFNFGIGVQGNIRDLNNNIVGSFTSAPPDPAGTIGAGQSSYSGTLSLCSGIYLVSGVMGSFYTANSPRPKNELGSSWFMTIGNFACYKDLSTANGCTTTMPIAGDPAMLNPTFSMPAGKKMVFSAWVREGQPAASGESNPGDAYTHNSIVINDGSKDNGFLPVGPVIDGWQRYEAVFTPVSGTVSLRFANTGAQTLYLDDIRIHPFNAEMKSYVYDPVNLRLVAELDPNNYAAFYEYDEEGTLIRTKAETQRGIKTIKESRSAKQRTLTTLQ